MGAKILLVHPGASIAIHDVWVGLKVGLERQGCVVYDYALDQRIEVAHQYLEFAWRRGGQVHARPTNVDKLYRAGEELVARALRVQPDVVLVVSAMFLHPDILVLLKRAGLKVACLFTESPYDDDRQARLLPWLDLAWTNERESAAAMGIRYLKHAWLPEVHQAEATETVTAHDVVFVGTGFQERIDFLKAVDWSGIDLGLYGTWGLLGSRAALRSSVRSAHVSNATATALYRAAKIGLNLYRTSKGFGKDAPQIASAVSLNPRAYELAATGCFTLSTDRAEVRATFGEWVPTFSTPQELRVLLDRWLADPEGRARVQAHLPSVVSDETWHVRAVTVLEDLASAGLVAPRPALSLVS